MQQLRQNEEGLVTKTDWKNLSSAKTSNAEKLISLSF